LAKQAEGVAQSPAVRKMSAIATAIAAGGATSSGSKVVDAYALLFAKKYREALPLLQAAYAETNPSVDGEIRTLLAWVFVETGAIDQAASLVEATPFVLSFGEPQFTSPILARYLFVRGAVLEHQGKTNEARVSQELYSKYAGITK
jgi:thioredoxin-like negative regulator of GroEL